MISDVTSQRQDTMASIEAVVFDIGETLVDEARFWEAWAQLRGDRVHFVSWLTRSPILCASP